MMLHIEDYYNVESGAVFIIGNGPGLHDFDLSMVPKHRCITMNKAWELIPHARYHINCCDITSVRVLPETLIFTAGDESAVGPAVLNRIKCPVVLVQNHNARPNKLRPKKRSLDIPPGLDLRDGWPLTHAGLLALNCAWWFGYDIAFLLGYDGYGLHFYDFDEKQPARHQTPEHELHHKQYSEFARKIDGWMEIYNCNKANTYEEHPYMHFEEALDLAESYYVE